ncbi:MAG: hypothetical protein LBV64_00570 [Mediterranea sp.]|nr:hypothetical protein [Mediterranea sp.]
MVLAYAGMEPAYAPYATVILPVWYIPNTPYGIYHTGHLLYTKAKLFYIRKPGIDRVGGKSFGGRRGMPMASERKDTDIISMLRL